MEYINSGVHIIWNEGITDFIAGIRQKIEALKSCYNDDKLSVSEWVTEAHELYDFASNIVYNPRIGLFKHLPLTENGKFPENKKIVVAQSKLISGGTRQDSVGEAHPVEKQLQIRLVPSSGNELDAGLHKADNTRVMKVDIFEAVDSSECLFTKPASSKLDSESSDSTLTKSTPRKTRKTKVAKTPKATEDKVVKSVDTKKSKPNKMSKTVARAVDTVVDDKISASVDTKIAKTTYLDNSEVKTGHLYEDKSGTKWLVITGCKFNTTHFVHNIETDEVVSSLVDDDMENSHLYIKYLATLDKALEDDISFNHIMQVMASQDKKSSINTRIVKCAHPKKFVKEVATFFNPADIKSERILGNKHKNPANMSSDWEQYTYEIV